jgi:hypothetical protein
MSIIDDINSKLKTINTIAGYDAIDQANQNAADAIVKSNLSNLGTHQTKTGQTLKGFQAKSKETDQTAQYTMGAGIAVFNQDPNLTTPIAGLIPKPVQIQIPDKNYALQNDPIQGNNPVFNGTPIPRDIDDILSNLGIMPKTYLPHRIVSNTSPQSVKNTLNSINDMTGPWIDDPFGISNLIPKTIVTSPSITEVTDAISPISNPTGK